jgi:hypothetical protein
VWPGAQGPAGWPQPEGGKKRRGVAIVLVVAFLVAVAGGYFVSTRLLFGGDKTIVSADGTMSLVVEGGWAQQDSIGGQPFKVAALNNAAQQAVGAIDLPKSELVPGASLGAVSQQMQVGVFEMMENEQLISTSPIGTTIAGLPAVEIVFRGDFTAGVFRGNVGFVTTIFDAPDRFVAVTAWTPGERFDAGIPQLRKIIASFKVNPPSSTA